MPDYTVRLLGPVQVMWEAGEAPRFRSQRTMALLGYLAAEGRPVARDALAALIWPDTGLSKAKANLRRELHNLGNILPDCWQADRQTVRFVPGDGVWVDVLQLLHLEEGEQWTEAAELVRGDFLEGVYLEDNVEFETWLLGERERWRQRAERVLSEAIEEEEQSGEHDEALRFARRLLQLLPWHEETHRTAMRLLALGGQRSAALRQFEVCQKVLQEELGVKVSAETRALYERIRDSLTFALHNIPAPPTPLIGREEELTLLDEWLADPDVRLITITGAGGMGKTRLALGLAQGLLARSGQPFTDGVYFVSLASLGDPVHLVSEIAAVLHFRLQGRDKRSSREQLLDYLRKKRMLLFLDNFEHLLTGASLITDILQAAPAVQILATSRERLRLRGEQVLPLHGLAYDDEVAGLDRVKRQTAAVRLFIAVAGRVRPDFRLGDGDDGHLSQICELVEGMPLALELAATWADRLSLAAIASEIEQDLGLLATKIQDVPERHRNMRAVFDASWRRLSTEERSIFTSLSVFRGGFEREAAEAVAGATIQVLSRLVNRSLIHYTGEADRYEVHELLRQYAASFQTPAEAEAVRTDHLHYFADLAEKIEPWRQVGEDETALGRLEREMGNFRAALDWSLLEPSRTLGGLRLAAGLEHFWTLGGYIEEGHGRLSRLLETISSDIDPVVRARALRAAGTLEAHCTGDRAKTVALYRESLALQEAIGDKPGRAKTLCILGNLQIMFGDMEEASCYIQKSLELAKEIDYKWVICSALVCMGQVALFHNDLDRARSSFDRGLPLARENGDLPRAADFLMGLGMVAMAKHEWSRAHSTLQEALALQEAIGNKYGKVEILRFLGDVARAEEQYERAEVCYQSALELKRRMGAPADTGFLLSDLGRTYLRLGQVDRALGYLQRSLLLGQKIESYELIYFALDGLANAACAQDEHEGAAVLWGAAESSREYLGSKLNVVDRLAHDLYVELARGHLHKHTFEMAWSEGREMSLEEAVECALDLVAHSAETTI